MTTDPNGGIGDDEEPRTIGETIESELGLAQVYFEDGAPHSAARVLRRLADALDAHGRDVFGAMKVDDELETKTVDIEQRHRAFAHEIDALCEAAGIRTPHEAAGVLTVLLAASIVNMASSGLGDPATNRAALLAKSSEILRRQVGEIAMRQMRPAGETVQ